MLPISPASSSRLPILRRDLSRLSARNLRRPSPLPRGPQPDGGYLARLKWLFSGHVF